MPLVVWIEIVVHGRQFPVSSKKSLGGSDPMGTTNSVPIAANVPISYDDPVTQLRIFCVNNWKALDVAKKGLTQSELLIVLNDLFDYVEPFVSVCCRERLRFFLFLNNIHWLLVFIGFDFFCFLNVDDWSLCFKIGLIGGSVVFFVLRLGHDGNLSGRFRFFIFFIFVVYGIVVSALQPVQDLSSDLSRRMKVVLLASVTDL